MSVVFKVKLFMDSQNYFSPNRMYKFYVTEIHLIQTSYPLLCISLDRSRETRGPVLLHRSGNRNVGVIKWKPSTRIPDHLSPYVCTCDTNINIKRLFC